MKSWSTTRSDTIAVGVVVAVAICLRLPGLDRSLWFDECIYSTTWIVKRWQDLIPYTLGRVEAPAYRVFMFLWTNLFGESEIALRLPSVFCAGLSLYLTFQIAAKWMGGRVVAYLAIILLAVSPVHVWYSREATPYGTLLFAFLCSVYAYLRLCDQGPSRRWLLMYLGASTYAVFAHFFVAGILPFFVLMAWIRSRRLGLWMLMGNGAILGALGVLLVVRSMRSTLRLSQRFLGEFDLTTWADLYFSWFSGAGYSFAYLGRFSLIAAICGVILGAFFLLRRRPSFRMETTGFLCGLPLVLLLLTLVGRKHFYIHRYLLVTLPFYCILCAGSVECFQKRLGKWIMASILVTASIIPLGSVYYFGQDRWLVYKPNPDWKATTQFVKQRETVKDQGGLWVFGDNCHLDSLARYMELASVATKIIPLRRCGVYHGSPRARREYYWEPPPGTQGTALFVENIWWRRDLRSRIAAWPRFAFRRTWRFPGVEVHEFEVQAEQGTVVQQNQGAR